MSALDVPWNHATPATYTVISAERTIGAAAAACAGILLAGWITRLFLPGWSGPVLLSSLGASSVLLFAVPASPMSHPWPLVGGHLCAGIIGVSCARYLPDPVLASAAAVAATILTMHLLRCLHPPGGGTALVAVLGGDDVQSLGYQFVLTPVALDVAVLLLVALLLERLLRKRMRPLLEEAALQRLQAPGDALTPPFGDQDLARAMANLDTYIDVSREDLCRIYGLAALHARLRALGDRRLGEVMDTEPCTAEFATPLAELWQCLQRRGKRAAAVLARNGEVVGVVTLGDFLRHAQELPEGDLQQRLQRLLHPDRLLESDQPEVAGQIMSRPAVTARADQRVREVARLLVEHQIRHLPVVDERGRFLGMFDAGEEPPPAAARAFNPTSGRHRSGIPSPESRRSSFPS